MATKSGGNWKQATFGIGRAYLALRFIIRCASWPRHRILSTPTNRAPHAGLSVRPSRRHLLQARTERDPPTRFTTWCALALFAEPGTIKRHLARRRERLEEEIKREQETIEALTNVVGRDAAVGRALVLMAINQMKVEAQGLAELSKVLLPDEIDERL
jgi:hypothetical protein